MLVFSSDLSNTAVEQFNTENKVMKNFIEQTVTKQDISTRKLNCIY